MPASTASSSTAPTTPTPVVLPSPQTSVASSQFQAMDVELIVLDVQTALDYVTETRADFQLHPHPTWTQERIDGFLQLLRDTLQRSRSFEVDHAETVYPWQDQQSGVTADVTLRDEDPKEFDTITKNYAIISQYFHRYFDDHVNLLRAHPDLTEGNPIVV